MLTIDDVALIFEVPPDTVRRWCAEGLIRAHHIDPHGNQMFLHEDVAIAHLDRSLQECLAKLNQS
jgi:DNA-binding transcriptional MerR regulator